MSSPEEKKFKELLEELFQFAREDLNFGIYRVMNQKRDALRGFIDHTIVAKIDEVLQGQSEEEAENADLESVRRFVKGQLGDAAFDENGKILPDYRNLPAAQVLQVVQKIGGSSPPPSAEQRIRVFNCLYDFFSRYYDDGDFMCKRRYAARDRYAIPYNGEEVLLHWANKDQYYIKTAEHFSRYVFKTGAGEVHFVMRDAELEKDNNKQNGEKYFIPLAPAFAKCKGVKQVFELPFEYRSLTKDEKAAYGTEKNGQQDKIIQDQMQKLPAAAAPFHPQGAEESPLLEHIGKYVRRNSADFFIHKNLRGFLCDELEYYINSELLNAEEMTRGNANAQARYKIADAVRQVAGLTIDFLAQLENFQKAIWEKKKFITETQYCATLQHLPDEELLSDIVDCEKQWQEWAQLNFCDGAMAKASKAKRVQFLRDHPTLVIDTVHFPLEFKEKLLAKYDNLDEVTDGVLFHCENWQALNLMQEKYRGQIKCIYIDPPYNTDSSAILYKNSYKDSAWMALMDDRLSIAKNLMSNTALICCAIDDEEVSNIRYLMNSLFEKEIGIAPVRSNPVGRKSTEYFSPVHEYAVFYGFEESIPHALPKTERELARYPEIDDKGRYSWLTLMRQGSNDLREDAPKMFYPIYVKEDGFRIPGIKWNEQKQSYAVLEKPRPGETVVYPISEEEGEIVEKNWHRGWERVMNEPEECRVYRNSTGKITLQFKARIDLEANPRTWWEDAKYASSNHGAKVIKALFNKKSFDFPKALELVSDCVIVAGGKDKEALILDYFAGSGTTGHAVINLNRNDQGRRKFILAEMGEYFDSIILPRIKKVVFTPQWEKGKPSRQATAEEAAWAPRLIKYHRIESYDDALENIELKENKQAAELLNDYTPRYMLKMESRGCATFTNPEALKNPFQYILQRANGKSVLADLPETFIYLAGMSEHNREVLYNGRQRYVVQRGTINRQNAIVIWRDNSKWKSKDYEKERDFIKKSKLTEGMQLVYFNDNSVRPNAKSLTLLFYNRMFGGEDE